MFLNKLQIFDFKNHPQAHYLLCQGINCLTGPNGVGKTNLLDAVYYLANAKSYFNAADVQLIRHSAPFFSIHGWFADAVAMDKPETEILLTYTDKSKKTLKKNGKTYQRLIDHIGLIQTVFITPYDISLVLDGSEDRRRFVDFTICQTDREYLETLSFYKKIQEQRNAFLKKMEGRIADPDILDSFDARLAPAADKIHQARRLFMQNYLPLFTEFYNILAQEKEIPNIQYISELFDSDYAKILSQNRDKDRVLMRTSAGIHKDDFEFMLDGFPLKKYGSQGQIKSFVIALKLAQYRYFLEKTGRKPILLLDDIFEKIDAARAAKLMELAARDYFGQIIITDTHAERVKEHLEGVGGEKKFFDISN